MTAVPLESLSTLSKDPATLESHHLLCKATARAFLRRLEWIYGLECCEIYYQSSLNTVEVTTDLRELLCFNRDGFTIVPPMNVLQGLKRITSHNEYAESSKDRQSVFDVYPRDALYEYILVPFSKDRRSLYSHGPHSINSLEYWNASQTIRVTCRAHPICVAYNARDTFSTVSKKSLLEPHKELWDFCQFSWPLVIDIPEDFYPPKPSEDDIFTVDSRDDDRLELGSDRSNPQDNIRLLKGIPPVPDLMDSSSQSSSQPESTLPDLLATGTRKRKSSSSHSSGRSKDSSEMDINKADRKRVELAKRNRRRVMSWAKRLLEREEDLTDDEVDDLSSRYAVEYSRPPEDVLTQPQLARRQSIS